MIGNLLYLIPNRSNIIFSVCLCARFQSCLKESHLIVIKYIIRYLEGTIGMGLWYPKIEQFSTTSFSDVDYTSCQVNRKSTSETCQFLGNCLAHGLPRAKILKSSQPLR